MSRLFRTRFILIALGCAVALGSLAVGRAADQGQLEAAAAAWDRGDYLQMLEICERLLTGPQSEQYVKPIAILTGEPFHTDELTTDGRSVGISPRGGYAHYTGRGQNSPTRIVALEGELRTIAQVRGTPVYAPSERDAVFTAGNGLQRVALPGGETSAVDTGDVEVSSVAFGPDDNLYLRSGREVHLLRRGANGFGAPERLAELPAGASLVAPVPSLQRLVSSGRGNVHVQPWGGGAARSFPAASPTVSQDGSTVAFTRSEGNATQFYVLPVAGSAEPRQVYQTNRPVQALAVSPSGKRIAFQVRVPEHDWEIFSVATADGQELRVTNEPQHDLRPHFLSDDTLLALKGESRHRRSHFYDLNTGETYELFHNNTLRTVAPQYEWVPSEDGSKLAVVAERDGDTISAQRGVYVMNLRRPVTRDEVLDRVRSNLAAERDLRERGEAMFAPIAAEVRQRTEEISRDRIREYLATLVGFGSRHVSRPGNMRGVEYLEGLFRSFGYEPALQPLTVSGNRTANIIGTLPGTENPELVYVVGAHMDSVSRGPGADDNASGTSMMMEAARVLARHPQPATIVWIAFTAEESGLVGSRQWVNQAVRDDVNVVGVLNNDMMGWTRDHRLDNTIRYSNPGIRDIQHAAAFLFSGLVTYDAHYYRSTDAASFYREYGDIVGGIGSYPILGNPHYHQATDQLETINFDLLQEVSKTTAATIMLLASSPSRLNDLKLDSREGNRAQISWTPSPERSVVSYTVVYGPEADPEARTLTVTEPRATLEGAGPGTQVKVRATNQRGLVGWDWAYLAVE